MPVAYIRIETVVQVELPENKFRGEAIDDGKGKLTEAAKERAVGAVLDAMSESVQVFIDGEDQEPAGLYFETDESNISETWCEG